MDRFCEDMQKAIAHEVRKDADEQIWVFRGATPNTSIEWSIRLGEILYNLRSALDHLVWQLVLTNEQSSVVKGGVKLDHSGGEKVDQFRGGGSFDLRELRGRLERRPATPAGRRG